jgi:hypothetical protein
VLKNGAVIQQGSGAGKFTVSSSSGSLEITLGTAAAVGDVIEVHLVVPVALLTWADAAIQFKQIEKQGYELLWFAADATATPSATNIYADPLGE